MKLHKCRLCGSEPELQPEGTHVYHSEEAPFCTLDDSMFPIGEWQTLMAPQEKDLEEVIKAMEAVPTWFGSREEIALKQNLIGVILDLWPKIDGLKK